MVRNKFENEDNIEDRKSVDKMNPYCLFYETDESRAHDARPLPSAIECTLIAQRISD